MERYSFADLIIVPLILFILVFIGRGKVERNSNNSIYKYYMPALWYKLLLGLGFCAVYSFYYSGGDTTNYHNSGFALVKLMFEDITGFFTVWLGPAKEENWAFFTASTGYPMYVSDANSFMVPRLIVPLELLTYGSYPGVTLLMSGLSFAGSWRLYKVLAEMYPKMRKGMAIAVLFIPSVVFWGAGIMKDTFTMAAALWIFAALLDLARKNRPGIRPWVEILIASWLIISIKPYIFIALFAALAASSVVVLVRRVGNPILRTLAAPFVAGGVIFLAALFWSGVNSVLGQYGSIDSIVAKADVTQRDLKRDAYSGNSIDIGSFDGTTTGAMSKFPQATILGAYRPFLWESQTVFMFVSGVEGTILLLFSIYVLLWFPRRIVKKSLQDPVFIFCFVFAIIMAYSVGLSTSNFGSLVRYRIPVLPFLTLAMILAARTDQVNERG